MPWCIIDRDNYTLVKFSGNFAPGLGTPECSIGMHIIEALDTDIIPAVSQIIDSDGMDDQTVMHGEKTYRLRRLPDKAGNNTVTLVFEDMSE